MMHATTKTLLLFVLGACAMPMPAPKIHSFEKRVVHSSRTKPGKGFEIVPFVEQVKDDEVITMNLRLTQGNPAGLDAALADVSNPASPNYGKWLTRDQIAAFTKPTEETLTAVNNWLAKNNITAKPTQVPEYLTFTIPIGQANSLLEAKYSAFFNADSKSKLIRTLSYSLPEAMEAHVRMVDPGTSFFDPKGVPLQGIRPLQVQAAVDNSDLITPLIARTPASLELSPSQVFALRDAIEARQLKNRRSQDNVIVQKRQVQEDPLEVLRKLNQTLGGTLPSDTKIIQIPQNGDLSGLDPTLRDIVLGILSGQPGTAIPVPVPVPTQAPPASQPVSSSTSVVTSTSTTTVTAPPSSPPPGQTSTPAPPQPSPPTNTPNPPPGSPSSVPIPVPTPGKTDASCAQEITPACIRQLYGLPDGQEGKGPVGIAVTGYIDQFGQVDDLRQFLQEFRTDVSPNTTFQTVSISGGENPQSKEEAGIEANLDLQYTIGISPGVPVQFVTVGKSGTGNGFLDTITTMISQENVPEVVTTSYGQNELDIDADVAEAMCDAYKQLTARGVSIMFASGDSGVGDARGECGNDGVFQPTFPSGCPFITSVGSTDGVAPERAASFSSGGFSTLYDAPSYQADHIAGYLAAHPGINEGKFNKGGRAFPDVSVQGTKFAIIHAGEKTLVQGTSASCPVFASMIALINAERAALGRPPMGFLNPWLYGVAAPAFMDVTAGSNPNCGTEGFPAAKGWDPVTGLGSPSFPALRAAAGLQ